MLLARCCWCKRHPLQLWLLAQKATLALLAAGVRPPAAHRFIWAASTGLLAAGTQLLAQNTAFVRPTASRALLAPLAAGRALLAPQMLRAGHRLHLRLWAGHRLHLRGCGQTVTRHRERSHMKQGFCTLGQQGPQSPPKQRTTSVHPRRPASRCSPPRLAAAAEAAHSRAFARICRGWLSWARTWRVRKRPWSGQSSRRCWQECTHSWDCVCRWRVWCMRARAWMRWRAWQRRAAPTSLPQARAPGQAHRVLA